MLSNIIQADVLSSIKSTGNDLGIEVFSYGVSNKNEIVLAFDAMGADQIQALMTLVDPLLFEARVLLGRLAIEKQIATSFEVRDYVEAGGLRAAVFGALRHWRFVCHEDFKRLETG